MFSPIPEILNELRAGRMIVLVDAEDRENEGDLVLPAQFATPDKINLMTRLAGGYLCLSLTPADCDRLHLHPMVGVNTTSRGTAFTVSIDGHPRHGVGTGASAHDRAKTISLAIDAKTTPEDFVRPGHVNPLRSREGGVLVRTGQTEGGVDLARLAGLHPSALIIEIVRDDGQMARRPDLEALCRAQGLKMCSIEQLIAFRLQRDRLVRRLAPERGSMLRTPHGDFTLISYHSEVDPHPHLALVLGGVGALDASGRPIEHPEPTLVRMHRLNLLGDVFEDVSSSPEGPTSRALRAAMTAIRREGRGAIVYLRSESMPSDQDVPSIPPNLREYGIGSQILRDLGLHRLRLLTNHPKALPGLDAFALEIVEHVPLDLGA